MSTWQQHRARVLGLRNRKRRIAKQTLVVGFRGSKLVQKRKLFHFLIACQFYFVMTETISTFMCWFASIWKWQVNIFDCVASDRTCVFHLKHTGLEVLEYWHWLLFMLHLHCCVKSEFHLVLENTLSFSALSRWCLFQFPPDILRCYSADRMEKWEESSRCLSYLSSEHYNRFCGEEWGGTDASPVSWTNRDQTYPLGENVSLMESHSVWFVMTEWCLREKLLAIRSPFCSNCAFPPRSGTSRTNVGGWHWRFAPAENLFSPKMAGWGLVLPLVLRLGIACLQRQRVFLCFPEEHNFKSRL